MLAAPYAPPRTRTQSTISTGPGLADFELLDTGYTGFVGQEFIPTRDPMSGLRQAIAACDV